MSVFKKHRLIITGRIMSKIYMTTATYFDQRDYLKFNPVKVIKL